MSAVVRDLLDKYDDPAPLLRAAPHCPSIHELLGCAEARMHTAFGAWLEADALKKPEDVWTDALDRYLDAYQTYAAIFEQACAEVGIGGNHE